MLMCLSIQLRICILCDTWTMGRVLLAFVRIILYVMCFRAKIFADICGL